jgi:hypothetical protein
MGSMSARDMANHCPDRETLVRWHLQSNHYPPVPDNMVPVALAAIEAIEHDDAHRTITLPNGVLYRGRRPWASAAEVATAFHLDDLIEGAFHVDDLIEGEDEP